MEQIELNKPFFGTIKIIQEHLNKSLNPQIKNYDVCFSFFNTHNNFFVKSSE